MKTACESDEARAYLRVVPCRCTIRLFEGLVQIAEDFDAPLADKNVFWGENTNEYGMILEQ